MADPRVLGGSRRDDGVPESSALYLWQRERRVYCHEVREVRLLEEHMTSEKS